MNCHTSLCLVLTMVQLWPCFLSTQRHAIQNTDQPFSSARRVKRGWVWNVFFVEEEMNLTEPVYVGQLKSDLDKEDSTFKYILTGEGAGSIFTINETTGVLHVIQKLDREKKALYTLRAQAINRNTQLPMEPESEFVIKVKDINDQKPQFLDGPYEATVPEMSPEGTSVIQVTATDGDDPYYGYNARLLYSIIQGQPYFSVEPKTGVIRISSETDRETQEKYFIIIQAKDMIGQMGGFSETATVTINLSDINDNAPKFQHTLYHMTVSEAAPLGTTIGKIMADDSDIGENAAMNYVIEGDASYVFDIITDNETQEGVVILKKKVDYETKRKYSIKAKVINRHIDERFLNEGPFEDSTLVRITVEDADEPPVFTSQEYVMEIAEGSESGSFVGAVNASDPDNTNSPIRYAIVHGMSLKRLFSINAQNGTIIITKPLDREITAWHNITVTATEARNPEQISEAPVYIHVLDVNDHAPEFPEYYETYVCENAEPGQLIQTISAVDKDDSVEGHHFYFSLQEETTNNSGFSVRDNQDNTAGILTVKNGFSKQEQLAFYLPILIADNGAPSLTSTNTLTVTVCDCDNEANVLFCRYGAFMYAMGLSTEALVAVLACILILLVFVLAILALRQQRKKSLFSEKAEEFRENIVRYDDEGGGEEDTEAFDIAALRTRTVMREHKPRRNITTEIQSLYRQSLQVGPDSAVFREFISEKLKEANADPNAPPYDSLQTYAFEGTGSLAGSLSSLGSHVSDMGESYDHLSEWGPHFKRLAKLYCPHKTARD
ncbi:cadherin-19 isoform X1 [Alligator sinensis]|uniref:Cadherin-19 isoform X1 n=1 Tax=Alligator sinensis TaxID=38654 RepID=A0A1U7SDJ0_ALLSI|nr:cadherin-19 isoform X1 [Alligator sinensis]